MRSVCFVLLFLCSFGELRAQLFRFAHVSDTHIGNPTAEEDLQRTVEDINADSSIRFVIISGDITEFGSDEELHLAKRLFDALNKPWYIIPGNHDANWSESGGNSFKKVFGAETFAFSYGGYLFLGTNCGPNMRMGPGQVPRENIMWLDSTLQHMADSAQPVIYVNHYPQNSSLNNWYEVIDRLKQRNIQLILCGHGHANHSYLFEGIPGIMGRSNLRAGDSVGGYNLVDVWKDSVCYRERKPLAKTLPVWARSALKNHHFSVDTTRYHRPSFAINLRYPQIEQVWSYQDRSDIGSALALAGDLLICTNTGGELFALDRRNGKRKWSFPTGGKIYSSPATGNGLVVVGSTDTYIYCLHANTGKLAWKYKTLKPVVASPAIESDKVFVGGSDGHFRALYLSDGRLAWDFDQVKGFVAGIPRLYAGHVYFGSWGNDFYSLNMQTGRLAWKWNNGSSNRMFSPASCYPVAVKGQVFIVAPDRYMTAFDAGTGRVKWRGRPDSAWVRESMGLSADSSLVYVKTMQGNVLGISPDADSLQRTWKAKVELGYELDPAPVVEQCGTVYIPTHSGTVYAVSKSSANLEWAHKISNCLINCVKPLGDNEIFVSTMDGRVVLLRSKQLH